MRRRRLKATPTVATQMSCRRREMNGTPFRVHHPIVCRARICRICLAIVDQSCTHHQKSLGNNRNDRHRRAKQYLVVNHLLLPCREDRDGSCDERSRIGGDEPRPLMRRGSWLLSSTRLRFDFPRSSKPVSGDDPRPRFDPRPPLSSDGAFVPRPPE